MAKRIIVKDYLRAMLNSGLYGDSLAEVSNRLICEGIQRAIISGVIPRRCLYFGYEMETRFNRTLKEKS